MLKMITLVENTAKSPEYVRKHGLCIYIETSKHKILFDLGPDKSFIENAGKMNIDLSEIDTVIISHGHKDHGGALKEFLKVNSKAKIYVKRQAFEPHYIKVLKLPFSVGLDSSLKGDNQIVLVDDTVVIDEELMLFTNVKMEMYSSKSNGVLYMKRGGKLINDDFSHEQNLIITINGEDGQKGKKLLVSGCSHAGIVNIQNTAEKLMSAEMEVVVGGFHLYNPPTRKYESYELIDEIAGALNRKKSKYYTCHCTGMKAYERMKRILGDKLDYLAAGSEIEVR